MKRPDVEKYEAMAGAATEGPWEWDGWLLHSPAKEDDPDYRPVVVEAYRYSGDDPNAELIAASRTAVPELCAYIRELEGMLRARADERRGYNPPPTDATPPDKPPPPPPPKTADSTGMIGH